MSKIIKGIAIAFILLVLCIPSTPSTTICSASSYQEPALVNNSEILQNVIARLMIKDIQKAVDNFYAEYTDYLPQVEAYASKSSTKLISLTYDSNKNTYTAIIKVEPYVTAHNRIGEDRITFEIDGAGDVKVKSFEHIKSYEYPPWLNVELKKPFPQNTN